MQRKNFSNKKNEGTKKIEKYYNSIAKGYNELYRKEQEEKIKEIILIFPFSFLKPISVLDVGCGSGISTNIINYFNVNEVVGIDPSIELLKLNPYKTVKAFAESIPFPTNKFDLVISLTVAQNFINMKKAINEIARVGSNSFILTILKKSLKCKTFENEIKKKLQIIKKIEGEKDLILFCKKNYN